MKSFARSFTAGEVTPQLLGRVDLAKYQTGLAKCQNFIVLPQGPVQNRAGFGYVLKAKFTASRCSMIPFTYNTTQSFALEFGVGYIRFHTEGATLLETAKALASLDNAVNPAFGVFGHSYAVGDWVQLGTVGGMPTLGGRWGVVATVVDGNYFRMNDVYTGLPFDTSALGVYSGGGTTSRVFEVATPYAEADLATLHYVQSADVLSITHQNYAPRELKRLGATNWTLSVISFVPSMTAPAAAPVLANVGAGGGTPASHYYVTTALAPKTLEESLPSAGAATSFDITRIGNTVEVQTALVTGAIRYNVYAYSGGLYAYVGQTDGTTAFIDDNIAPSGARTPPVANDPFTGDVTFYPRAVSYYEQRRAFGGSIAAPQNVWLTRSGTESNMSYSIPTQDDDSITARIVSREATEIRHLVPLNDLLAFSSGAVWKIASADGGALTPSSISVKPQSYVGASNAQPAVGNNSVLYVAERGSHMREVAFTWQSQSYRCEDISVFSAHLFDHHTISQLAYSRAPLQIGWAIRDDGVMLGLTHIPEQDVRAWHQHTTQGAFESVCVVPEGVEDGVYVVVNRTLPAGGTVRYIERMHSRQYTDLADAFFVDSGVTYSGAAVSTISGLNHLEGFTVAVLADGGVEQQQVVTNGAITLSTPASKVQVGLPYNADLQTLPLLLEAAEAFGLGTPKNVNEVSLQVRRSSSIQAGPSFDKLRPFTQRAASVPFGTAPTEVDEMINMKLSPDWQQAGTVCVRQPNPLPIEIASMVVEVA